MKFDAGFLKVYPNCPCIYLINITVGEGVKSLILCKNSDLYFIFQVRFAWNTKKEQLEKIRDIMNLDDYKNITALFTPLKTFLAEQDKQVNDEDTHLKQEEADVTDEQNLFNTHPCPCVWGQWSTWSTCSHTCGGGTINRSRNVTQHAKNAGDSCAGSSTQQMSCNPDPCRKENTL